MVKKTLLSLLCGSALVVGAMPVNAEIVMRQYSGFTLWIDCDIRSAVMFSMSLSKDTGNIGRTDNFRLDPNFDQKCQQTSTKGYYNPKTKGVIYHRGHLVSANQMDFSSQSMNDSFFMTNIVPQTESSNTGAWLDTEVLTECWREEAPIVVLGGVIYDNDRNDYFVDSHGIKTPDMFWKVLISSERTAAFLIPNTKRADRSLDRYAVSVNKVEKAIGLELPITTDKDKAIDDRYLDISNCDKS